MSVSADFDLLCSVTETLTGPFVDPANPTVGFNGLNTSGVLNAGSTVPATKHAADVCTMSDGTGSINLAALPGKTAEETVVGTGLKVQILILRAKATNANPITVAKGASNGYGLNAANGTWSETLDPGQVRAFYLKDSAPDIASDKRVWDVTGTGAQGLEYQIVMG